MRYKDLSDISSIIMGQSPAKDSVNRDKIGYPLLNGPTEFSTYSPKPVQYTTDAKRIAPKGSLLFCVRGSTTGRMNWADQEYAIGRGLAAIVCDEDYQKFYVREIIELKLPELLSKATGSTFPNVSKQDLHQLKVPFVHNMYFTSNFVANVSNKIELNNQMIATLEELAATLFKQWFVDFEFPDENGNPYKSSGGKMVDSELGEIPEGWEVKSLTQIAVYKNGLAMQKFRPTDMDNSLPVLKIKELNQGFVDSSSDRCSIDIKDDVKVFNGDVIFSWSGTLLVKLWTGGNAGLNQHLFKVTSDQYGKWFYFLWTKHYLNQFIEIAKDKATTMGHIKRENLNNSKVCYPTTDELWKMFSGTFSGLIDKLIELGLENNSLKKTRDSLLPKLLLGELNLKKDD
ncbi:restriction endonuclease subunit S [Enterococcus avium]|uniref:restriction endonuclease subunit S n=1 Tax=Enterococcus avium TaxID=33945 RepID=UPI0032E527EB